MNKPKPKTPKPPKAPKPEIAPIAAGVHMAGYCLVDGEPVADIIETFKHGRLDGMPRKIGGWHGDANRVRLVLTNGSTVTLTVRAGNEAALMADLPGAWAKLIRTSVFEYETRAERNAEPLTPAQKSKFWSGLRDLWNSPPIGALGTEKWKDLDRWRGA